MRRVLRFVFTKIEEVSHARVVVTEDRSHAGDLVRLSSEIGSYAGSLYPAFVEVHGIIASHFRPRRHLLSAADYHRLRATYAAKRNFFRSFAVAAREAYLVQLPKGIKTPENGKWVIKVIKWLDIQLLLLEVPFRLRCLTTLRKFLSRCCGCFSTYNSQ
jgi:hypothetical protein